MELSLLRILISSQSCAGCLIEVAISRVLTPLFVLCGIQPFIDSRSQNLLGRWQWWVVHSRNVTRLLRWRRLPWRVSAIEQRKEFIYIEILGEIQGIERGRWAGEPSKQTKHLGCDELA
jgi:hypothetical protein